MQNNVQCKEFYNVPYKFIAKMATGILTKKNISGHTFQYNDTNGWIIDNAPNDGTQIYRVKKGIQDCTAVIRNETTGESFVVSNLKQLTDEIQLRADITCMNIKDIANKTVDILSSKMAPNRRFALNLDGTVSDTDLTIPVCMDKTKTYKFSYYDKHQMLMTDNFGRKVMVHNLRDISNKIFNGM